MNMTCAGTVLLRRRRMTTLMTMINNTSVPCNSRSPSMNSSRSGKSISISRIVRYSSSNPAAQLLLSKRTESWRNFASLSPRTTNSTSFSTTFRHQQLARTFSTIEQEEEEREVMSFDVLIVGGGPAGLAASIRIKQLCQQNPDREELSVCVIDKGSEIGSHILSGNVFDPIAINELFPNQTDPNSDNHWTKEFYAVQDSIATPVSTDTFKVLTESGGAYTIPTLLLPPQLHNHGNYIISLSQLCRYLATKAEELGVEIYPGFAASEVLLTPPNNENDDGTVQEQQQQQQSKQHVVRGIATRDVGLAKDGTTKKSTYERGVELHAKQTFFAEGARGSCSEWIIDKFNLRSVSSSSSPCQPQTYGLGLKEVWQVPPEQFLAGYVQHTVGYPLQSTFTDKVYGGSFLYHQEPDLVLVGLVVGLDYANPNLNPYKEFQRWKTHPDISKHLENGTCISYGARVLNEGGYHSIPKVTFPGGALLGCSAGLLNPVKIKGSHSAIKSGILAAEAAFEALTTSSTNTVGEESDEQGQVIELTEYQKALEQSWIYKELYEVRNTHAAFAKWGIGPGMVYTGLSTFITKGREPWTLQKGSLNKRDCDSTEEATKHKLIEYPAPDNKLTFDLLTNLQRSGTYHADDQPIHLRIKPHLKHVPESISLQMYNGPEQNFCPAAVYEYVDDNDNDSDAKVAEAANGAKKKKLVINSQNCIHCKCCSIKMPSEYIEWTVPEGGGGPQYQNM